MRVVAAGGLLGSMLIGLMACESTDRAARVDMLLAQVAQSSLAAIKTLSEWRPSAYRRRGRAATELNQSCEGCHVDIAEEWRSSRHHRSFKNSAFGTSFEIEPKAFCRGCHAPEAADPRRADPAAEDMGVGCVSCHVDDQERVHGRALVEPNDTAPSHEVVRTASFSTSAACVGCHDFAFPGRAGDDTEDADMMQTTTREHRRSAASGQSCADCHMPQAAGRRSHAFGRVRNVAWLRSSLDVRAEITTRSTVVVRLKQTIGGHAMPTGDLFRRIEVAAELTRADGQVKRRVEYLARRFVHDSRLPGGYRLVADDRLFDDERSLEFDLTCRRAGDSVRYSVTLQRVSQIGSGHEPAKVKMESSVLLHEGEVCRR